MATGGGTPMQGVSQNIADYISYDHINKMREMGYEFHDFLGKGAYGAAFRCEIATTDANGNPTLKQMAAKVLTIHYNPSLRPRTPAEVKQMEKYDKIKITYTIKGKETKETVKFKKDPAKYVLPDWIENPMGSKDKDSMRRKVSSIDNELKAMVKAEHQNVVKLENVLQFYDEYVENPFAGSIVIFMELAVGDFFDHLGNYRHTEDETKQMIAQIACGVQHLHSLNIAHCDLKTENILVFRDQHNNLVLKLTDFGLSILTKPSDPPTGTDLRGTAMFLCPSQLKQFYDVQKGKRTEMRYDPTKVDMWALALITMIVRYNNENIQRTYERSARSTRKGRFSSGYLGFLRNQRPSPDLMDLMSHVIVENPDQRYDINQFCDHQWIRDAVIAHKATYTTTPTPPSPLPSPPPSPLRMTPPPH